MSGKPSFRDLLHPLVFHCGSQDEIDFRTFVCAARTGRLGRISPRQYPAFLLVLIEPSRKHENRARGGAGPRLTPLLSRD